MHSDKLGLAPASSSPDSDHSAEQPPTETLPADPPAKRPRRTLTRKPKVPAATQLALDVASPEAKFETTIASTETTTKATSDVAAAPTPVAVASVAIAETGTITQSEQSTPIAEAAEPIAVAACETAPVATDTVPPSSVVAAASESLPATTPTQVELPFAITHRVHPVALGRKREALQQLLTGLHDAPPVLLYTRTKHGADKIARFLERCGINAAAIHGDKSHGARQRAITGFKAGEVKVLVVTDIAARLLDVTGLPLVLSYDLPHVADDYVQRVLRCGGEGATGLSLVLITQEEAPQFRSVRDLLAQPLEVVPLAGFEALEPFDPERDPPARTDAEGGDGDAATSAAATASAAPQAGESRREGR
ncbi:MAG: hypothetical protein DYH17_08310, partial [Xanthomonadales bacterium PRO6]|nr:hypothetical protein [Xanthomonadales bacterium PRO6]